VTHSDPQTIAVSAPVRLDFAGAWTDVAPFALEQRGVVVNAAIDLRTHVEVRTSEDRYRLRADDLDEDIYVATIEELARDGKLELLKAALRRYRPGPCSLRTSAEAPPGSGLGTSGALSVALVHAMTVASGKELPALDVAHEAWQLETVDAAVAGGRQDQYAAALGGFQRLVIDHGTPTSHTVAIDPAFAVYLANHIVICYTGRTRFSANTITRVMDAYTNRDSGVVAALHAMADLAEQMAEALVAADLARIAVLLDANWKEQQQLDPGMCTAEMAQLDQVMADAGALGGKAAGSGAGGSMFYVVPGNVASARAAARAARATLLPVRWAQDGVRVD
jgi:D-glycero-alpha-D-manno-heptose-7-phosphate kinase